MTLTLTSRLFEDVQALLGETGEQEILPCFRHDDRITVSEKSPGELVTQVDQAAERRLASGLQAILPGARVIGEETWTHGAPVDASVFGDTPVWVIDPLDGTKAFVEGSSEFAIMVALIQSGETLAAWIHAPVPGWTAAAELGSGATLDGAPIHTAPTVDIGSMRGSVRLRFLPPGLRERVEGSIGRFSDVAITGSSGWDHVAVAQGRRHFSLYYRTLVWDHAPGCLIVSEAGGAVARFDGSPYIPLVDLTGLLTACNAETWSTVHQLLLPETDYRLTTADEQAAG